MKRDPQRQSVLVLTTAYPDFGPKEKNKIPRGSFVHDMARAWVREGFEVHVLTHFSDRESKSGFYDGVNVHRFHYFFPALETLTDGSGIPENIKKFKNKILAVFYSFSQLLNALFLIRRLGIQTINAHWAVPTGFVAAIAKRLSGRWLVTTCYGAEFFPVQNKKMSYLKVFLRLAITHSDVVVAISEATATAVRTITGATDISVIPDGIDINYYVPGSVSTAVLGKYGVADQRFVFFTSRMVERKGHRYLLEAIALLRMKKIKVKLILGGDGPLFLELLNLRKKLDLEDDVLMPGPIPECDMVALLRSCSVFVLPSCIDRNGDTEGSATSALQAMACGTPALVSRVGGNIGAINDGEGAFYIEPSSARSIADTLEILLNDPPRIERLGVIARNFVVENYSWSKMIRRYIEKLQM